MFQAWMIRHMGYLMLVKRPKETPLLLHCRMRLSDRLTRTANANELNPLKLHYSFKNAINAFVTETRQLLFRDGYGAGGARGMNGSAWERGGEQDTEGSASESYQGRD